MSGLVLNLAVDAIVVILCLRLLWRQLSFVHPVTMYIFFHVYCFSWRAWALYSGSTPMYGDQPQYQAITVDEFIRALYFADAALVAISVGALVARKRFRHIQLQILGQKVNPRHLFWIVISLLPVGIIAMIVARIGLQKEEFHGIVSMIAFWPPAILLMLIFYFGFRWYFMALMGAHLTLVGLQGYHRFMLTLPLIFLLGLYLQSKNRRWPTLLATLSIILFAIIFPDLKEIGRTYHAESIGEALKIVERSFDFGNRETSSNFLDQLAGGLSMTDDNGRIYYGETYLYALTLPIPRFLWPSKPGLGNHIIDISTSSRNYEHEGRVITLIGESYLNFWLLGVVLVPFVLGWGLTQWFFSVQSGHFHALNHYVYLVFLTTLIQVYRDGLSAFLYFGVFQNAPMVALVCLQIFFSVHARNHSSAPADAFTNRCRTHKESQSR
jgi:hypothetical protein